MCDASSGLIALDCLAVDRLGAADRSLDLGEERVAQAGVAVVLVDRDVDDRVGGHREDRAVDPLAVLLDQVGDPVGVLGLYLGPIAATVSSVRCVPPLDGAAVVATIVSGVVVAQAATYRPSSAPTIAMATLTPKSFFAKRLTSCPCRLCGLPEALRLLPDLSLRLLKRSHCG